MDIACTNEYPILSGTLWRASGCLLVKMAVLEAPYGIGLMVMLSSRRGPMEMISIGQPISSSSLFT